MISERSSFLDNEVSKFVDETLATPSLPSAASLKLIPGGELIFRERPKIFFVLFCFFFQKINQCSNCHQTQSIENVVLTSMFVKVEFQKFKKKRVNMGAAELEEKMMSTLKLYAKIQAVQGIFMVLMPYQAAVLVGYDKGRFLFFRFDDDVTFTRSRVLQLLLPLYFLLDWYISDWLYSTRMVHIVKAGMFYSDVSFFFLNIRRVSSSPERM